MKNIEIINAIFGGIVKIIKAIKCKSSCCKSSCDSNPEPQPEPEPEPEPESRSKVTEL
jgi:hypothetical protein